MRECWEWADKKQNPPHAYESNWRIRIRFVPHVVSDLILLYSTQVQQVWFNISIEQRLNLLNAHISPDLAWEQRSFLQPHSYSVSPPFAAPRLRNFSLYILNSNDKYSRTAITSFGMDCDKSICNVNNQRLWTSFVSMSHWAFYC